jgi:hypothetical protein
MTTFQALRLTRTGVIRLNAPPAVAFPLFTPEGERQWAPGWDPTAIYPASGEATRDMVFSTKDHDQSDIIWSMVAYDQDGFAVSYLRVAPTSHVARIDVRCAEAEGETADATVSYCFTGLTEAGNAYVAQYTEAHYRAWLQVWASTINNVLAAKPR